MIKVKEQLEDIGFKMDLKNKLYDSYKTALKDENFKLLIKKLNLNDEQLMKYTSLLEESSIEFGHCLKCKGLVECKNKVSGHAYLPFVIKDKIDFSYKPCKYQTKLIDNTKHLKNIFMFDIPKEVTNSSMKKIYTDDPNRFEIIKWINSFLKEYSNNKEQKGLYLYGNFGSGKTYLLAAMFNELAKLGYKSAIIFWPEFLRELKSSFQTDFKEKYNYIKKVPLLLIDDIGAESTTEWGRDEILCPLIQYRMQNKLPTFFTSNLDLESLEKHFSVTKEKISSIKARRIIERIKQITDFKELISKNLRDNK